MATPVAYPAKLPCPTAAPVAPTERRLVSDIPGDKQYRGLQRDFHGTQELTWIFTSAEAKVFGDWWKLKLRQGGFWFAADWPLPSGKIDNVYRFMAPPSWSFQPGGNDKQGIFTVTAKLEIRGRGMLPMDTNIRVLTSRPYPVINEDSLAMAVEYVNTAFVVSPRNIDLGTALFELVGVTLTEKTGKQTTASEDFATAAFEMVDVSLSEKTGLVQTASADSANADFSLMAVTLQRELTKYTNWQPESASAAFTLEGVTLE